MRILSFIFLLILCGFKSNAQNPVWMHPNFGQWDNRILYSIELFQGNMFIERDGFTYCLNDVNQNLRHRHDEHEDEEKKFQYHVIRSKFVGSGWEGEKDENDRSPFYRNYFYGNNPADWKSELYSYSNVQLSELYSGVDLILDGSKGLMKYSLIVEPGTNPDVIKIRYEGQSSIRLDENGRLVIGNRFGEIIEGIPVAWTEKEGKRKTVKVEYLLTDSTITFNFPKGYDETSVLVIDPDIVFSTFTGSTMDNWGMTATPDNDGNTYAGGIVFAGAGSYPTVPGSFDVTFNGGSNYTYTSYSGGTWNLPGIDVAISKFNEDGTALVYSTYLGGTANEAPHSMYVDENDELYVFGVTSSSNFPVTAGSYDPTFNGGPSVSSNELGYPQGADLYVVHFNAAGTGLIAGTFVGGSGTDGINMDDLDYNYGDPFRGEIIVDNGSVYVSSTSRSSNFPTVNAAQGALSGIQDAVIFKLNAALNTMYWSTYFGGNNYESGNSLQVSSAGDLFVTGGTNSTNLPISGGIDLTFNGGVSDGYLLKMDATTGAFQAGTYIGQNEYDQGYFVQLDIDDEVYVFGQTESNYAINAPYGVPNSGQFIRKYSNDLSTIQWTTTIGGGTGNPEISPTAFLVSDCYDIYISGWGGTINTSYSHQAFFSTTNGFPVTGDAFQSTTNGSNFYIAVLGQDASTLKYATYMGGLSNSYNHVDGGTSRFDKSGRIYHAVCGACGGDDFGFTTTPGVWSPMNMSSNCNLAAFKFELNQIEAIVAVPDPIVCLPDPVIFNNSSINGNFFYWSFGDGDVSYDENTTHVYDGPGTYTVTLVVSDTAWCFTPDSAQFEVYIGEFQGGVNLPSDSICPGEPFQFDAFGGETYLWSPAAYLDNPNIANPTAVVYETMAFQVIVSDSCGIDTIQVILPVFINDMTLSNDTSICIGNDVDLFVTGGISVEWSPPTFLDDPNSFNPNCLPTSNIQYVVDVTTSNGCLLQDSVSISVYYDPPVPILPDSVNVCQGSSIDITCGGGEEYYWSPPVEIAPTFGPTVTVTPTSDRMYIVEVVNACGSVFDSVFVEIVYPSISAGNDTIICPGETAYLWASGAMSYTWFPSTNLIAQNGSTVSVTPTQSTTYLVTGVDEYGCAATANVTVELYPQPNVWTNPDVYAFYDEEVQLYANSSVPGTFVWSPTEYLSCVACTYPTAIPNQNFTYYVLFTDQNGCTDQDTVNIIYDPFIYVPNTFTPDGDEFNNGFRLVGGNMRSFELNIFNRWGELIYTIVDLDDFWDGTYKGIMCQDGTYVWKLKVIDLNGIPSEYTGHVNLLR